MSEFSINSLFDDVLSRYTPDASLPGVVARNRSLRARARIEDAVASLGTERIPKELDNQLRDLVKEWANRSFEDGYGPIEDFEITCARQKELLQAQESGDESRVSAVLEGQFRERVIKQYGSLELRGIQISHRVILDLDEVYIPLHLETSITEIDAQGTIIKVEKAQNQALDILRDHQNALIIGSPGSGKSTLVSYVATGIAEGRLTKELKLTNKPLPFVILARTVADPVFTPEWFERHLGIDIRLAKAAIREQRVVLLLDGVDEATIEVRNQLLAGLRVFLKDHPRIRTIVTSRPSGGMGEIEKCFHEFTHLRIADFSLEDVEQFIDKWCLAAEKSARKDSADAKIQAGAAASDLKSRIAISRPVQRIAVNPLLTTILCVVHRFLGRSIPEHRVVLYEKCTDALLYEWDRAKFATRTAVGALDAPQKRALLRGIASSMHEKHAAEINEQEVIQHFANILPTLGKPQSDAQQIVQEIRDRSGLLVERRPNVFAFSHLTFQEYFTALDYVSTKSWERLMASAEDPWWHEVIALAAGAPGTDSVWIVRELLKKKTKAASILAAQCTETALDLPLQIRKDVESALDKFLVKPYISGSYDARAQIIALGVTVAPLLMKHLDSKVPLEKSFCLSVLEQIDYEPAIPAIAACVRNKQGSHCGIDMGTNEPWLMTIGEFATFIILEKSQESELARRSVENALPLQRQKFLEIMRKMYSLDDELSQLIDESLQKKKPARASHRR